MADNANKLGSIIYGDILPERDAVHIAIIPGTSNDTLKPGDRVSYNNKTNQFDKTPPADIFGWYDKTDGIVDPFVTDPSIKPGTAFWVCLKPGSILSLRHSWVHKSIPAESSNVDKKTFSHSWLEGFAHTADMSYDSLIWAAKDFLKNGDYVCNGGQYLGFDFPDAFWDHYETVTDEKVPENKRWSFFSCSC